MAVGRCAGPRHATTQPAQVKPPSAKYQMAQKLGCGASGSVFVAWKRATRGSVEQVALKRMSFVKQSHEVRLAAMREIKTLTALESNPFVVDLLEHWQTGVQANPAGMSMVMSLCNGGDLASFLKKQQQLGQHLPESTLKEFLCQILLPLRELHARGVMHRDVKLENFCLHKSGRTGKQHLKMIDFGSVSKLGKVSRNNPRGDLYDMVGTTEYMSPERIKWGGYDETADVWGAGVVIYALAALSLPFESRDTGTVMDKIIAGKVPKLPAHYSAEFRQTIMWMLTVKRLDRPSADEVLQSPCLSAAYASTCQLGQQLQPDWQTPALGEVCATLANMPILTDEDSCNEEEEMSEADDDSSELCSSDDDEDSYFSTTDDTASLAEQSEDEDDASPSSSDSDSDEDDGISVQVNATVQIKPKQELKVQPEDDQDDCDDDIQLLALLPGSAADVDEQGDDDMEDQEAATASGLMAQDSWSSDSSSDTDSCELCIASKVEIIKACCLSPREQLAPLLPSTMFYSSSCCVSRSAGQAGNWDVMMPADFSLVRVVPALYSSAAARDGV